MNLEQRQTEFAKQFGLSLEQYKKLAGACSHIELVTCLELLRVKKHKSGFRARCHQDIWSWINHGLSIKPLSHAQFKLTEPSWPTHFQIPQ